MRHRFLSAGGRLGGGVLIALGLAFALSAQGQELRRLDFIQDYLKWAPLYRDPVFSATHGKRLVRTYLNAPAWAEWQRFQKAPEGSLLTFPPGSLIVKDSWENVNGKPGPRAYLFVMRKEAENSRPAAGDWYWAIATPDFRVLKWQGKIFEGYGGNVQYCVDCHKQAEGTDFFFGSPGKLPKK
ncbi:MAG: cytochrome P460 family protein [Candidatus Tectomicrobia bacterium]|uniref:Cytochrome P460 family protein n=1 Tax=Tectimicrobiota bacterium TaxID=2528274 RepID=A0A932MN21_UNCTE|nr:cytochrome P460 family protein [Candidatus Tectomicrobia bacterium]